MWDPSGWGTETDKAEDFVISVHGRRTQAVPDLARRPGARPVPGPVAGQSAVAAVPTRGVRARHLTPSAVPDGGECVTGIAAHGDAHEFLLERVLR